MRALIFGADGQLGRSLIKAAPCRIIIEPLNRRRCDVAQKEAVRAAIAASSAEIVINAAAFTSVDDAEGAPETALRINGSAPGWMANAALRTGKKFIHISTDYVFGVLPPTPIVPDSPRNPLNVYGMSKLAGEKIVASTAADALIVRTSWVHAAFGRNFVGTVLRLARESELLRFVSDQIGTPTSASTLADSIWQLVDHRASGVYHVTDAGVASWYDFAVAIVEEGLSAGLLDRLPEIRPISTSDYPTAAKRPHYSVLDKRATWTLLGASAPHWRTALRTLIAERSADG